jgi:hypothetical protein
MSDRKPDAYLYESKSMVYKEEAPRPELVERGFTETPLFYPRKDATTKMFVVMSNDYPAAIMSDETAAETLVERFRRDEKEASGGHTGRVNWRVYEFDLDNTAEAERFHLQMVEQAKQNNRFYSRKL